MPGTPTEIASLRTALEELRGYAIAYAEAGEKIQRAAMDEAGWQRLLDGCPSRMYLAASSAIQGALADARGDHGCSDFTALQLRQSVVDALDVFEFAIARDTLI